MYDGGVYRRYGALFEGVKGLAFLFNVVIEEFATDGSKSFIIFLYAQENFDGEND